MFKPLRNYLAWLYIRAHIQTSMARPYTSKKKTGLRGSNVSFSPQIVSLVRERTNCREVRVVCKFGGLKIPRKRLMGGRTVHLLPRVEVEGNTFFLWSLFGARLSSVREAGIVHPTNASFKGHELSSRPSAPYCTEALLSTPSRGWLPAAGT